MKGTPQFIAFETFEEKHNLQASKSGSSSRSGTPERKKNKARHRLQFMWTGERNATMYACHAARHRLFEHRHLEASGPSTSTALREGEIQASPFSLVVLRLDSASIQFTAVALHQKNVSYLSILDHLLLLAWTELHSTQLVGSLGWTSWLSEGSKIKAKESKRSWDTNHRFIFNWTNWSGCFKRKCLDPLKCVSCLWCL